MSAFRLLAALIGPPAARSRWSKSHMRVLGPDVRACEGYAERAVCTSREGTDLTRTFVQFAPSGAHKIVQKRVGHPTTAITFETCSHVLPGMGEATARAMDEVLRYSPVAVKGSGFVTGAFHFSALLQSFIEWRDPDSNRGHHDFQLCG